MSVVPRVNLSDVAALITKGTTPKTLGFAFSSSGVPFLRAENIQEFSVSTADNPLYIDDRVDEALRRSRIEPNDVLISIAGTIGRVGIVPTSAPRMNCNQAVALIRLGPQMAPRFLGHWLRSPDAQEQIARGQVTATIPNLSLGQIGKLRVPSPNISEQRRIADILDKADAIRRKRKEAIALTEELLRATFLEMFGDPVTNPKGWAVKALGDVMQHLDAGWSANGEARVRTPNELGVLKISAVTSGTFRAEEHKAVSANAIDRELVTPRRGDLLFSRANTRELVAATCLVERDEPRLFLPDKLWRVVPRADAATAPYLRFLLAHERVRSELTKTATGTSGSMLNVSMEKLRGLRAPFPPIDLQSKFAAFVWSSLGVKARHERAHEQSEDLFNNLVARAFSGALETSA